MTDAADHDPHRTRALIVLLIGASIIGAGPIFVRLAEVGPAAAGMWRLLLSLPLLLILARRGDGLGAPTRATVLAGLAFAFDLAFWHYGIAYTSVAKATVLSNLTPVVVTAVAWIFLKQRPRRMFMVAVALAVAGAWTMAAARSGGAIGKSPALGDALSTATAFWYAMYILAVSSARRREGATRIMFWSSLVGAPLLLLAALGLGERLLPLTPAGWAACIGLGVMHVTGQGAIAWALGRLPAATAAVVVLIEPVVAAVLGWWLFGELIGHLQMLGAALALSGVVLAQWASRARPIEDPGAV